MNTNNKVKVNPNTNESPILAGAWDVICYLRGLAGIGDMIMELELTFADRLDESSLTRAVELLFESEPILARRLVIDAPRPQWEVIEDWWPQSPLIAADATEYEAFRHSGIDAAVGPQVAVCLWHDLDCDRLIVKVTHEVTDSAGLKTIGLRLASIYSELQKDATFVPPANRPSPRGVDRVLDRVSLLDRLQLPWDLLKYGLSLRNSKECLELNQPSGPPEPWVYIVKDIKAPRVSRLLAFGQARGATLNDFILAAMYRALAGDSWRSETSLRIFRAVDLRRWYLPAGESGSICNLSSFDLPFLQRDLGKSFEATLERVVHLTKRSNRQRPGLAGSALLHWLRARRPLTGTTLDWALKMVQDKHYMPALTNAGPLDRSSFTFGSAVPDSARVMPSKLNAPGLLLSMSGYQGGLSLAAGTPLTSRPTVDSFVERLIAELPA